MYMDIFEHLYRFSKPYTNIFEKCKKIILKMYTDIFKMCMSALLSQSFDLHTRKQHSGVTSAESFSLGFHWTLCFLCFFFNHSVPSEIPAHAQKRLQTGSIIILLIVSVKAG